MSLKRQEIFDAVWRRARDKRKAHKSPEENFCMYRVGREANAELRCFIGALIPDDKYNPNMEGTPAFMVVRKLPEVFGKLDTNTEENNYTDALFVNNLQRIHDALEPEHWKGALMGFALCNNIWLNHLLQEDKNLEKNGR